MIHERITAKCDNEQNIIQIIESGQICHIPKCSKFIHRHSVSRKPVNHRADEDNECINFVLTMICIFFCYWYEVESLVLVNLFYLLLNMQESAVAAMRPGWCKVIQNMVNWSWVRLNENSRVNCVLSLGVLSFYVDFFNFFFLLSFHNQDF